MDDVELGGEALGGGDGAVCAELRGGEHEGVADVVAVADVGEVEALCGAEALFEGEEVGDGLAGVLEVGEGVDDGDLGAGGHLGDGVVGVGAEDDDGHPALDVVGHVGEDSRSPRGDWVWSTKMALPPRVLMAVSKVRRVRREAFSKNMTIWRASRAWRKSSGLALTAWASSMMAAISSTVRSAMEQRSRPWRRLEASVKAVSDWMPRVARGVWGRSLRLRTSSS